MRITGIRVAAIVLQLSFASAQGTMDARAPLGVGAEAELTMIRTIDDFARKYEQAGNKMAKGMVRHDRSNALCRFGKSPLAQYRGVVSDRIGTISEMDAVSDGRGILAVRLSPRLSVATTNNDLSEMLGPPTLVPVVSAVHRVALALAVGQAVRFSGTLFPYPVDCARETSLTVDGGMEDPSFLFRFTELHAIE